MRSIHTAKRGTVAISIAVALCVSIPAAALASSGGAGTPAEPPPTVKGGKAKMLKNGKAVAPEGAPIEVKRAIKAGNRIRKKPYIYGGGHKNFKMAKGYDCSGSVSWVLHGAGNKFLSSPEPSGPLMHWGKKGKGHWITVYANGGHAFMIVAGLRFDTSAMGSGGNGPEWRKTKRSHKGYKARHYPGF